jgi:hypothetical protein
MLTLKYHGIAWGETRKNPDGTVIYDGAEMYIYNAPHKDVLADSWFLIQKAGVKPGWNDRDPVVPASGTHWFTT